MGPRIPTSIAAVLLLAASGVAAPVDLAPGFPRTIFFRSERQLRGMEPAQAVAAIARFDAISVKLFNEAARMRFRDLIPVMRELKKRRPEMPVLLHLDHFAAVRELEGERMSPGRKYGPYDPAGMFPGHWLYYPGCKVVEAIDAKQTVIRVANAAKFQATDDVRIWPAGAIETPRLWRQSEAVFVERVDVARNVLHVRRGQFRTKPVAFANGAMAAPHCKMKYGNPAWYWSYNLSLDCPKDEQGRPFAHWFADWVADEIAEVNAKGHCIDGVEFDVTKFNLTFGSQPLEGMADGGSVRPRPPDCNVDGVGDWGYTDGMPTHGFGTIECMKRLRDRMGPSFLITGDSIWTLWRPWPYANGLDNESFPDIRKPWRWSGAFERVVDWQRRCAQPRMSFFFTRASHDRLPGQRDTYQTVRLSLAATAITGCWHCVSGVPGGDSQSVDEYHAGAAQKRHWLGKPLGEFVRVPQYRSEDLLGYGAFDAPEQVARVRTKKKEVYTIDGPRFDTTCAKSGKGCLRVTMAKLPRSPRGFDARLVLPMKAEAGREYTLDAWLKASHDYGKHHGPSGNVAYGLTVSLWAGKGGRENTGQHALLVPSEWRRFHISIVARPNTGAGEWTFELGAEPGTLWIDDARVYEGGADAFYRRFEGGLVLANATRSPVQFDLHKIEPERGLRRIQATQVDGKWQSDPEVNAGQRVDRNKAIELGAFDALFLLAE